MSDLKRATLITVGAPKSAKNNVKKTVRLTISLDKSNENKCPELNYKELVIAEEKRKRVENGKTTGPGPFSDSDDEVERVARKFEQKYGGKNTYGRKGRPKMDDFADIGAGYDESDSFIDNTHGYDEMIPPECDTFHGGFYINCGSLEFKNVPENQTAASDVEHGNRRNKRRISSSSSEEESSESSSESESQEEKDPKAIANGTVDSHKTEHRKKKNKKVEKNKAKKIRRTDSSAATSGKQTSDDNAHGDGESGDSRTSQSDSLASKPAPSSENAITSDSSRDVEAKDIELPAQVLQAVEALEVAVSKYIADNPSAPPKELLPKNEQHVIRLERELSKSNADAAVVRGAWTKAASCLSTTRTKLIQWVKSKSEGTVQQEPETNNTPNLTVTSSQPVEVPVTTTNSSKSKKQESMPQEDYSHLSDAEREAKIVETLKRLENLINDRKPEMIATYNAECQRVQQERKKQQATQGGTSGVERRLPKRRFPWCQRARALLSTLRLLAGEPRAAATLLSTRALPLFPPGFVRMPTLLRQADLSKDVKVSEIKRQRLNSASQVQAAPQTAPCSEVIHFPSSLTVTTTTKVPTEKPESQPEDFKHRPIDLNTVMNTYNLGKDMVVEKPVKKEIEKKEDHYVPPNNIGCITITPVVNHKEKKSDNKGLIRVKSPAALNDMVKKDRQKKDKNHVKDKPIDTPLHVETSYEKKKAELSQKQIETMRVAENNLPRPALVPVHSPTFAKPDKRPPEVKKKRDIVIVSDLDPLGDNIQEPLVIDDSSSDVEMTDETVVNSEKPSDVPSKDKSVSKKVSNAKSKVKDGKSDADDAAKADYDAIIRNIQEMGRSQEPTMKMNSPYGGVITNESTSLRITDGCNNVSGANASTVKMIKS